MSFSKIDKKRIAIEYNIQNAYNPMRIRILMGTFSLEWALYVYKGIKFVGNGTNPYLKIPSCPMDDLVLFSWSKQLPLFIRCCCCCCFWFCSQFSAGPHRTVPNPRPLACWKPSHRSLRYRTYDLSGTWMITQKSLWPLSCMEYWEWYVQLLNL